MLGISVYLQFIENGESNSRSPVWRSITCRLNAAANRTRCLRKVEERPFKSEATRNLFQAVTVVTCIRGGAQFESRLDDNLI